MDRISLVLQNPWETGLQDHLATYPKGQGYIIKLAAVYLVSAANDSCGKVPSQLPLVSVSSVL